MYQRTVEIGHTYAPERLIPLASGRDAHNQVQFSDTAQAAQLRAIAETLGMQSLRVALVDDVVAHDKQTRSMHDSWRWALFIGISAESVRAGTGAELVAFESAYEPRARKLVDEIKGMSLPASHRLAPDESGLIVGSGKERQKIPLTGFKDIDDPTHPSCQILDLAWLEARLELAPEAVTILPTGYERQQAGVAHLASLFEHLRDASVQNIYIS